jgi:leukotriene-A4 hydrolase
MSARHCDCHDPVGTDLDGVLTNEESGFGFDLKSWCEEGRVVEEFVMEQPIPPYLFAFAVGELGFREVGPRTRVYSEAVDGVLDAAAREFAGTEEMIRQAERLFGEYDWERFDLLVLPPSFPYAGMENPRMVFLTPTVIKGDASGARLVAHELAHSWTGNLITNKNNEHFWLNEVQ